MGWEDKLFWLVVSVPIIPCVISFIIGGVIGTLAMAILNATSDYKDPATWDYIEGGEDDAT